MRSPFRPSVVFPPLVALTLVAGACSDSTPPEEEQTLYAFLGVTATPPEPGEPVRTSPVAVFYRFGPLVLPTGRATRDSCAIQSIEPPGEGVRTKYLNAGDSIRVELGGVTSWLKPDTLDELPFYGLRDADSIAFTPGANATFTIPGAPRGYPATTITARTAEAFTLGPVPAQPPIGQPITITWTPAGDENSKMTLGLEYASQGSATRNQVVVCTLKDDGSATIPANRLGGWRAADLGKRLVVMSRLRTTLRTEGNRVVLVLASFDVETQPTVTAAGR